MEGFVWQYWTKEEDDKLRELWEQGYDQEQASVILKTRSRSSVKSRAQRLGFTFRHREDNGREAAREIPTLAHVPGVEICGRYTTRIFRVAQRERLHGALKRPRSLYAMPARERHIIHLGGGRVWQGIPFQ